MVSTSPSSRMPVFQDEEDAAFFQDFGPPDDEVRDKPIDSHTRPFETPDAFVFRHDTKSPLDSTTNLVTIKQARKWLDDFETKKRNKPPPPDTGSHVQQQASEVKTIHTDLCVHEHERQDGVDVIVTERALVSAKLLQAKSVSSLSQPLASPSPLSNSTITSHTSHTSHTSTTATDVATTSTAATNSIIALDTGLTTSFHFDDTSLSSSSSVDTIQTSMVAESFKFRDAEFKLDVPMSETSFVFETTKDSKRGTENATVQILTWSELSAELARMYTTRLEVRGIADQIIFSADFICDLKEAEAREYICHVCSELLSGPVEAGDCGHVFCQDCLEKWFKDAPKQGGLPTCPTCRAKLLPPPYRNSKFLESKAGGVDVSCGLQKCAWKGSRKAWFTHRVDTCLQTLFKCTWCDLVDVRQEIPLHEKTCELRLVICDECHGLFRKLDMNRIHAYHGCEGVHVGCSRFCGIKVRRSAMDQHLEKECIMRPVACQYEHLGCTFKDVSSVMRTHEAQYKKHFHMALEYIMKLLESRETKSAVLEQVREMKMASPVEMAYDSRWKEVTSSSAFDFYHRLTCIYGNRLYSIQKPLFEIQRLFKKNGPEAVFLKPCPRCEPLGPMNRV